MDLRNCYQTTTSSIKDTDTVAHMWLLINVQYWLLYINLILTSQTEQIGNVPFSSLNSGLCSTPVYIFLKLPSCQLLSPDLALCLTPHFSFYVSLLHFFSPSLFICLSLEGVAVKASNRVVQTNPK